MSLVLFFSLPTNPGPCSYLLYWWLAGTAALRSVPCSSLGNHRAFVLECSIPSSSQHGFLLLFPVSAQTSTSQIDLPWPVNLKTPTHTVTWPYFIASKTLLTIWNYLLSCYLCIIIFLSSTEVSSRRVGTLLARFIVVFYLVPCTMLGTW